MKSTVFIFHSALKRGALLLFFCFIVGVVISVPLSVYSSSLSEVQVTLTKYAPSDPTDVTISFRLNSGLTQPTDNFEITFDSGFDVSAIDANDIALFHGPVTGEEKQSQVSDAVTTTNWGLEVVGRTLTFKHPSVAGNNDIADDAKVKVRIGLHAGGDAYITNPPTEGTKLISMQTSQGDQGSAAVAISDSSINVTAEVSAIDPVALGEPYNITSDSVDISWTQSTSSKFDRYEIYYSYSPGVSMTDTYVATINDSLATSTTISGMSVSDTVYIIVVVYDTDGNYAISNEVSGTYSGGSQVQAPPPAPTVDDEVLQFGISDTCTVYTNAFVLAGKRSVGIEVMVNGSSANIVYPSETTWQKEVTLTMGENIFEVQGVYPGGLLSEKNIYTIQRNKVGDSNGNGRVDDFDLAGVAYHWSSDWCFGDFNKDGKVNDLDLAGLAAHWDGIFYNLTYSNE